MDGTKTKKKPQLTAWKRRRKKTFGKNIQISKFLRQFHRSVVTSSIEFHNIVFYLSARQKSKPIYLNQIKSEKTKCVFRWNENENENASKNDTLRWQSTRHKQKTNKKERQKKSMSKMNMKLFALIFKRKPNTPTSQRWPSTMNANRTKEHCCCLCYFDVCNLNFAKQFHSKIEPNEKGHLCLRLQFIPKKISGSKQMHVWIKWKLLYSNPSIFAEYLIWITNKNTLNICSNVEWMNKWMCNEENVIVCIFWSRPDTRPSNYNFRVCSLVFEQKYFPTRKSLLVCPRSQLASGVEILFNHFGIYFDFDCDVCVCVTSWCSFDFMRISKLRHSNWVTEWI